jgi:hypothetical protein
MQRILIIAGVVIFIIGIGWPWISRLPIGRLPGDLIIDRPGMTVYIPITTMILVSVIVSIIMYISRR